MNRILLFTIGLFLSGCVTVNVGNKNSKKAEGVKLNEPSGPFKEYEDSTVDRAWRNGENGNTISFFSECGDPGDPPLDQIVNGVLSGLSQVEIQKSDKVEIQGREGRHVMAQGKVDGVETAVDLRVFKRNQCLYILSLVGVVSKFKMNVADFEKFTSEFRAP